jgi:ABC-2 type transport system ATP-binding protein
VDYTYRTVRALDDVSFALVPGVTGLIGVNGAGKSTLLSLLATSRVPRRGSIEVQGIDIVRDRDQARRLIGYMPQSLDVPLNLRVREFLSWMAWLRGFSRSQRPELVLSALAAVDLVGRAEDRVGSLSGGMHRRMLLGQALLGDPPLLLLDEPTAGLDPEQRVKVRALIAESAATRTTVVSSHLMDDLAPIAAHMIMLDAGRVVFDGSVAQLAAKGYGLVAEGSGISPYEAAFLSLRAGSTVS